MKGRTLAFHPIVPSGGVGLTEMRAALEELRTAHRLLLATSVEDDVPTSWMAPLMTLLMAPIWFDPTSWGSSTQSASDLAHARHCVRRAIERLEAPVPEALDELPLLELQSVIDRMFAWIRASHPALRNVDPLADD
jgi:hypothetical protein